MSLFLGVYYFAGNVSYKRVLRQVLSKRRIMCGQTVLKFHFFPLNKVGGWVVRWCWVNFQQRGVLLVWITVGQRPAALAVGAGGGCLDIFSLVCRFSFLSPSLWETARYRLKYMYSLKGPLSPKQPSNQPTNHPSISLQ